MRIWRSCVAAAVITALMVSRAPGAPPWFDNAGQRGFPENIPDFYQHQRWGNTGAAPLSENDTNWERDIPTGRDGGWCRPTAFANGFFYWKQNGYANLLPNAITANNTWLQTASDEIQTLARGNIGLPHTTANADVNKLLKDRMHGADKGAGPGNGLNYTRFAWETVCGVEGLYYYSSDGAVKLVPGTVFDQYRKDLLDGKNIELFLRTPDFKLPGGPPRGCRRDGGGTTYDPALWWAGQEDGGCYHNVTGAGIDVGMRQIFFADPDSNKGNAKANAGTTWVRPDLAVDARKYVPPPGGDPVPVPARGALVQNDPVGFALFYNGVTIAADGWRIDGTVAANERYRNVGIRGLEVIGPLQAAAKPQPPPPCLNLRSGSPAARSGFAPSTSRRAPSSWSTRSGCFRADASAPA